MTIVTEMTVTPTRSPVLEYLRRGANPYHVKVKTNVLKMSTVVRISSKSSTTLTISVILHLLLFITLSIYNNTFANHEVDILEHVFTTM